MREWERGMCLLMHLCLWLSQGFSLELHGSLWKDCSLCVHSESLALHLTLLTAQPIEYSSPFPTRHLTYSFCRYNSFCLTYSPFHRYKVPCLFHWSHDLACLSTSPFPRGSSGLLWGWGSWWQIWGIWGDVTMAESESGEGSSSHLLQLFTCFCLFPNIYFYTHEGTVSYIQ